MEDSSSFPELEETINCSDDNLNSDDEVLATFLKSVTSEEPDASSSDDEILADIIHRSKMHKRKRPNSPERNDNGNSDSTPGKRVKIPLVAVDFLRAELCCNKICFKKISERELQIARDHFQKLNIPEQTQWLYNYLHLHSKKEKERLKFVFVINGTEICQEAWQMVLGVTRSRIYDLMANYRAGQRTLAPVAGKPQLMSQIAREWLSDYASKYADRMPDTEKLHLPCCLTKRAVYETYMKQVSYPDQPLSKSHFYRIWRNEFINVTIPQVSRFAKCENCLIVKQDLKKAKDPAEKRLLLEFREQHLRQQNLERRKYYHHRKKAIDNPEKYMSLIIDGMDQAKTFLPHFVQHSKATSSMWKLRSHVTGVLVHGQLSYGFFDHCQWEHSSNLTLSILLEILYMYRDSLPPILYLQLDNCGRENKNRFVFGFCCLLVQLKLFKKIKIGFLMVGHTHEDVDQMFSRYSTWLLRNPANTLPQLMDGLEKASTPQPTSVLLERIFNISEWLKPYLAKIQSHSRPHLYKIELNEEGKAFIVSKKWSTDEKWQQCEGQGNGVLLKGVPPGHPQALKPSKLNKEEIDRLEADYESCAAPLLCDEDKIWWENFLSQMRAQLNVLKSADPLVVHAEDWRLSAIIEAQKSTEQEIVKQSSDRPKLHPKLAKELEPISSVIIGPKTKDKKRGPLSVGDMCLLDMEEYEGEFQIAKVKSIDGEHVEIEWYEGTRNSKIKPHVLMKKGKGKFILTEIVKKSDIWHYGFKLTKAGYLSLETRLEIDEFLGRI